jgi:hypothetical protein
MGPHVPRPTGQKVITSDQTPIYSAVRVGLYPCRRRSLQNGANKSRRGAVANSGEERIWGYNEVKPVGTENRSPKILCRLTTEQFCPETGRHLPGSAPFLFAPRMRRQESGPPRTRPDPCGRKEGAFPGQQPLEAPRTRHPTCQIRGWVGVAGGGVHHPAAHWFASGHTSKQEVPLLLRSGHGGRCFSRCFLKSLGGSWNH